MKKEMTIELKKFVLPVLFSEHSSDSMKCGSEA